MKFLLYPLAMLLLYPFQAYSQKIRIDWGKEFKAGNDLSYNVPVGLIDNSFYTMRYDMKQEFLKVKKLAHLEKMDENLNFLEDKYLENNEKLIEYEFLYKRRDEIHIVSSELDKKAKEKKILVTVFDLSGNIKKGMSELFVFRFDNMAQNEALKFKFSGDSSQLLIYQQIGSKKKDKARIYFSVIGSEQHEVLLEAKYELPYLSDKCEIKSALLDREGNSYFFIEVEDEKTSGMKKWEVRIKPHLIILDKKVNLMLDKELEYNDLVLTNISAGFNSDNHLLITALTLAQEKKKKELMGFFFCTLDPLKNEFENVRELDFDLSFKKKFGNFTSGGMMFNKNFEYEIKFIPDNENGGGYIIAENSYIIADNASFKADNYLLIHRRELIVLKFNADKSVEWIQLIPKRQMAAIRSASVNLGPLQYSGISKQYVKAKEKYLSYLAFLKDGALYIMFNDHEKNMSVRSMKDVSIMESVNKAKATIVIINPEDGRWRKRPLFTGKDIGVVFCPESSWANDGNVIILAENKSMNRYGRVIIE